MRIRTWLGAGVFAAWAACLSLSSAEAASSYASLSPSPLEFGTIQPSASKLLPVTVTNTSSQSLKFNASESSSVFATDQTTAPSTPRANACFYFDQAQGINVATAIVPDGTCSLYFRFSPTANGDFSTNATVGIYDVTGSTLATDSVELHGVAAPPEGPATTSGLEISPSSTIAFGPYLVGESVVRGVTVKNVSNGKVVLKGTYSGGAFTNGGTSTAAECFNTAGTEATVLSVGDSCSVVVKFKPSTASAVSGSVTLETYGSAGNTGTRVPYPGGTRLDTKAVALSGTGATPTSKVAPTTLAFSNVTVGSTSRLTATVTNTSKAPLRYTVTAPDDSPYSVAPDPSEPGANNCNNDGPNGTYVVGSGSCLAIVDFNPTATGSQPGTITIHIKRATDSLEVDTLTLKTTGTGVAPPAPTFTVSPTSLKFGNVTANAKKSLTVTVTNTSDATMRFVPSFPEGSRYGVVYDFSSPDPAACYNFNKIVAKDQTCTVEVSFSPSDYGSARDKLTITGSQVFGFKSVTKSISVTGTGIAPTFTVSPTTLAFGKVTANAKKTVTVTVTNTSETPMLFNAYFPQGSKYEVGFPPPFDSPLCNKLGNTVAPNATCPIEVSFKPIDYGSVRDKLTIVGTQVFGPKSVTKTLNVSGTGIAPTFTVSPTSLKFGNVTVQDTKTVTVTVTNTSETPMSFNAYFPQGSKYEVGFPPPFDSPLCNKLGNTVAPNATCPIEVSFKPIKVGAANDKLTITGSQVFGFKSVTETVAMSGRGTAA
jgi:hypothetical protein